MGAALTGWVLLLLDRVASVSVWRRLSCFGFHQPGLIGDDDGLYPVAQVQPHQDSCYVGLHGRGGHDEVLGDFGVGHAGRDELEDFELARCELLQSGLALGG